MEHVECSLGVCDARVLVDRMTAPPPNESWEPAEPMDPRDLPPGFYFPPGSEPGRKEAQAAKPVWMLVAIVTIVLLAGVVGVLWLL